MHEDFSINGLSPSEYCNQTPLDERMKAVQNEILSFSEDKLFNFQSSGTTGKPKQLQFSFNQLKASSEITHKAFNLSPKSKVLHALPMIYVAGKMMLYRSLIMGYDLWITEAKITADSVKFWPETIDFAPLVPLQVQRVVDLDKNMFSHFSKVLIGGAPISNQLVKQIQQLSSTSFYESYGSTETLTHIALRNISNHEIAFTALPTITLASKNDQLEIYAPHISESTLVTNDVVQYISENQFIWKGRADYVINSGGVKIHPEQIELKLASEIDSTFIVAGIPHDNLGEQVVLIVEGKSENFVNVDFSMLSRFEVPKRVFFLENFAYTESGKVKRIETINLLSL